MVRVLTCLVALAFTAPAFAQLDEEDPAAGPGASDPGPADTGDPAADPLGPEAAASAEPVDTTDPENSGRIDDEQALAEDESDVDPDQRSATDPFEEEHTQYFFLGIFYRHTWTPKFLISLFTDEQTPADNPAAGLELTIRKDNFEIVASLWYQAYFVNGPFRGNGDTIGETEFIDSELKAAFIGAAFLWSTMFTDWIGLEYGLDIGIGGVWGDLHRNEAYESTAPGSVGGWAACAGPGNPVGGDRCDATGGNYGVEPSWIDGGSRPLVYARLAPHLAIRIKPIHQLVFRIDGGFDLFSGFFVGGAAAFGF